MRIWEGSTGGEYTIVSTTQGELTVIYLQSWRLEGKEEGESITVEECREAGTVAIVIERVGDQRRMWLSREAFEALCDLRYRVEYAREAAV